MTLADWALVVLGGLAGGWVAALLVAVTRLEREVRRLSCKLELCEARRSPDAVWAGAERPLGGYGGGTASE